MDIGYDATNLPLLPPLLSRPQVVRLDLDRSQQVVLRLCGPGCIHILLRELAAAHINGRWGPRHEIARLINHGFLLCNYVHTTDHSPN
jgi:hypothetical protein